MGRSLYRIPHAATATAATLAVAIVVGATAARAVAAARPITSTYQAGYYLTEPGITRASVHLRVPTVSSCASSRAGSVIGIGDEQPRSQPTLLAGVEVACTNGVAGYRTETLAGGVRNTGSATPGDLLVVSMTQTPSKISISVRNKSTGKTVTSEGRPVPDHQLIFGVLPMFAHGAFPLPVADFGSAHLTRPHLEDAPLAAWSPTRVNRSTDGVSEVVTSRFVPASTCHQPTCGGSFYIRVVTA